MINYLAQVSTIAFWLNISCFAWYIPVIVILYIFFPFYIKFFKKRPYWSTLVVVALGFILSFVVLVCHVNIDLILLFTFRIPIFFIGILFGKLSLDQTGDFKKLKVILYILMLIGFVLLYFFINVNLFHPYLWKGLYWLPFIIIVPGLVLSLSFLFDKYIKSQLINKLLNFLGAISLELYLVQIVFFNYIEYYSQRFDLNILMAAFIIFILSVLSAMFLHKITYKIVSYIEV